MTDAIAALRHDHEFLGKDHDRNARRTLWVVALTAVMMVGEIVAGSLFGSMALLADGFHMATHAGALTVAAVAYGFARRNSRNPRYTFGTGKVGDLAGFASALVLGVVALAIAVESGQRLISPTTVAFDQAIIVAVIGLAVNLVSALLLSGGHHHGHSHGHHHDHHHDHHDHDHGHHHHHHGSDNNLRAAYLHVLADALTSVLAIIALVAGKYANWVWLDPAMGIVGAIVIARWSWSLMRDTAGVLLDTADPHLVDEIRQEVEGPGDSWIADLHVWRIGPDAHAAVLTVATRPSVDISTIRERLKPVHELVHVTVERHVVTV
ncbi:MAG TPA: CDF family Co(II)/Ni(II) efflux transporter DmeF [Hyphomonadaceae bacterium]|nr:CDF family Co(II)/Ni(II) efflux transporter DmeF [Hyphomonadaceae bacterium]